MKKSILTIILAILILTTVSIHQNSKAEPKKGQRIVLVETYSINECTLTIISIDKKEYLINSQGGIQILE